MRPRGVPVKLRQSRFQASRIEAGILDLLNNARQNRRSNEWKQEEKQILIRVEGRTRAWEVVGMETTGELKIKLAATWKWKERDQVHVMRQGNVLDDKKTGDDMWKRRRD